MGEGVDSRTYDRIAQTVARVAPDLDSLAADLHATPEVGFAETRSAARIAALLGAHGHQAAMGSFGLPTSFVARAGSGGPHVAFLAEYDALPGLGHACGHNVIAAISVGAFLAAAEMVGETGGQLSLIGTPAEEGGGGKELIRKAGGFDDVDAAMLVHPEDNDSVYSATSGLRDVKVRYIGRAAHAAGAPHMGINALDAMVTAYQSLAQLRQHLPKGQAVHGIITRGGDTPNVVPALTEGTFLVRSADLAGLYELSDRVGTILTSAATATGCAIEMVWDTRPPYLPLNVSEALGDRYAQHLARLGRPAPHQPPELRFTSPSSDVGNISYQVATLQPTVAITPPGVANHTEEFARWTVSDLASAAVVVSAQALAATAVDFLRDQQLRHVASDALARTADGARISPQEGAISG
jgi:amidohydrolase